MPKFSAQHYNAIAKEVRLMINHINTSTTEQDVLSRNLRNVARAAVSDLAVNLAKRFKEDNDRFDPRKFLDACSPNTDVYPLSELWAEDDDE